MFLVKRYITEYLIGKSIKSYSCVPCMNNINNNIIPAVRKATGLSTVTDCMSDLLTKHLLIQLLINMTMVLVKTFLKKVVTTIHVLLKQNLVKRALNCLCLY